MKLLSRMSVTGFQRQLLGISLILLFIHRVYGSIKFTVHENQPKGTPVGQILTQTDYKYTFARDSSLFSIDENSGAIRTKEVIDREKLPSDSINLLVVGRLNDETHTTDILIEVADQNDNAPEFLKPSMQYQISEQVKVPHTITLPSATDKDKGVNSVTSNYRIVSGNVNDRFSLSVTSGDSENAQVMLIVSAKLDRELVSEYTLNISAADGGNPVNYGYLIVKIFVDDYNDNAPAFHPSKYTALVNETASIGTLVVHVAASDADQGKNQEVKFKFKETSSTTYKEFVIDPQTGQIFLANSFTCYRETGSCFFIVEARDSGNPPLSSQGYVNVMVADDNDHAPTISVSFFNRYDYATVPRGSIANGFPIATIVVQDGDLGQNGNVTLAIVDGNINSHFKIKRMSLEYFLIHINISLNDTSPAFFNLVVEAKDMGEPPLSSRATIKIKVSETNRYRPIFNNSKQTKYLSESIPIGSYVASMYATDNDTGINGQLFYKIEPHGSHPQFEIDPNTGLVTTKQNLDFETTHYFNLNISVSDRGVKKMTSYGRLQIFLLDVNDNAPIVQSINGEIKLEVEENKQSPTTIYTFSVSDKDAGNNASILLFLDSSVQAIYGNLFYLAGRKLISRAPFDFERLSQYIVRVVATDNQTFSLSSTVTVIMNVKDLNDNLPIVYPTDYFVLAHSGFNYRKALCRITATDSDSVNSNLIFTIDASSTSDKFVIDSHTGWLYRTTWLGTRNKTLKIKVSDSAQNFAQSMATVHVFPNNLASTPYFPKKLFSTNISEDFGEGFTVRSIVSVGGERIQKYLIIDGDMLGQFHISDRGFITTVKTVDREVQSFFNLSIVGYSSTGFDVCFVEISVFDLNDNGPSFASHILEYFINDTTSMYYVFAQLTAMDRDEGQNSVLRYSISAPAEKFVSINSSTGDLVLVKPTWEWPSSKLTVTVTAHDKDDKSTSCQLTLNLGDTNNFSPVFSQPQYNFSVFESESVHRFIGAVSTSDSDTSTLNNKITFSIIEPDFEDERIIVFPDGQLYSPLTLDRENKSTYRFKVSAKDNGHFPSRSAEAIVTIMVLDSNDNAPLFPFKAYDMSLNENEPIGSTVGYVSAFDMDAGINSLVMYKISNVAENEMANAIFLMNSITGKLTSNVVLDRETTNGLHHLVVEAFDGGGPSLTSSVQVTITINDVNDNAPKFSNSFYTVSIMETAIQNDTLINVLAHDADIGQNAKILYSIKSGNVGNAFHIDSNTGRIFVNSRLDRERTAAYVLIIEAFDSPLASVPLSSTTKVLVTIIDTNDVYPVFIDLTTTNKTVNENILPGVTIFQLKAQDPDFGKNGECVFTLVSGNSGGLFGLNSIDGRVYVKNYLDYETAIQHLLVVAVSDSGVPSHSSTATLTINVNDVNDHVPQFPTTPLIYHISEAASPGTALGRLRANDADTLATNRLITYHLIDRDNGPFRINSSTGVLTLVGPMDREVVSMYQLRVTAQDGGAPQLTSTPTIVTVMVTDTNDHVPTILTQFGLLLPLGLTSNKELIYLQATDKDIGSNAIITFKMDPVSSDRSLLNLNEDTGALSLVQTLNSSKLYLDVRFAVSNNGSMSTGFQNVRLIVQSSAGRNDGPKFRSHSETVSISEANSANKLLLTLKDESAQGQLEFWITGVYAGSKTQLKPRGLFQVDRQTGKLRTGSAGLDREATPTGQYEVEVTVMDASSSTPRTRSVTISVGVDDVNDTPPKFASSRLDVSVAENAIQLPTILTTLAATDPDLNSVITYSINTTFGGLFRVDSKTGRLSLIRALDFESKSSYSLLVTASDSLHSTHLNVVVEVLDLNDHAPTFVRPDTYNWTVSEAALAGTVVGRVTATDADSGLRGRVRYQLLNAALMKEFNVDAVTGLISTSDVLDFEMTSHYLLLVSAYDSGEPSLTSTTSVVISVDDINDKSPIFNNSQYRSSISEAAPVGIPVLSVQAVDADQGFYGRVEYFIPSYYLTSTQLPFSLHPITGVLSLAAALDREKVASYSFPVRATDGLYTTEADVFLTISDVDDSAPVFVSLPTSYIMENNKLDEIFHTLKCSDPDLISPRITYSLHLSSSGRNLFSVDSTSGQVQAATSLDREVIAAYELRVLCSDGTHNTEQLLKVQVLDSNDHTPVFSRPSWSLSVSPESTEPIARLAASDRDLGSNGAYRFFLLPDVKNGTADFTLNSLTGDLSTVSGLASLKRSVYYFTAFVTDLGFQPRLSSTASIRVDVSTRLLACKPYFYNTPFIFNLADPPTIPASGPRVSNIPIVYIRASACSATQYLRYYMKSGQKQYALNETSGLLTFKLGSVNTNEQLIVQASNKLTTPLVSTDALFKVQRLSNKFNPPICVQTFNLFNISESASVGSVVFPLNVLVSTAGDYVFALDLISSQSLPVRIDDQTNTLRVTKPLDRETQESYLFNISVGFGGDLGFTRKTTRCLVQVVLLDVNDNLPQVMSGDLSQKNVDILHAEVKQGLIAGSFVCSIPAWDPDQGSNGTFTFRIDATFDLPVANLFSINRDTGFITLASPLPPSRNSFKFRVQIIDGGHRVNSLFVSVTVVSTVGTISLTETFPSDAAFTVRRDAAIGHIIGRFAILYTNQFDGEGTEFSYFLAGISPAHGQAYIYNGGLYQSYLAMNSSSGDLYLNNRFALSGINSVNIIIGVRVQKGSARNFVHKKISVSVTSAANPSSLPSVRCSKHLFVFAVQEGVPSGSLIGQISPAAPDNNRANGQLRFTMLSSVSNHLTLDSNNGHLKVGAGGLDSETVPVYNLVVAVQRTGGSGPAPVVECRVRVTVTDRNEFEARFSQSLFTGQVLETASIGDEVLRVTAQDKDIGASLTFTWSQSSQDAMFSLNPTTGVVTVAKRLDYEKVSIYNLRVSVTNGLHSEHTADIRVNVIDVNDWTPRIPSGFSLNYTVLLARLKLDPTVIILRAEDNDKVGSENARVTFSIVGPGVSAFKVNSETGLVQARSVATVQTDRTYSISVILTDHGLPPRSSQWNLKITVLDDSYLPRFVEAKRYIPISTNARPKDSLGHVLAKIPRPIDHSLMYKLIGGNGSSIVTVNSTTGELSLRVAASQISVNRFYLVLITASLPLSSNLTNVTTLRPAVINFVATPTNANDPVISANPESVTVPENNKMNKLFTVSVSDRDSFLNGMVNLTLSSTPKSLKFRLIPTKTTGTYEIHLASPLDYEVASRYTLRLVAKDAGLPPRQITKNLIVFVSDANDSPPKFNSSAFVFYLPENASPNTVLGSLKATDLDSSTFNKIEYLIHGSDALYFTLNQTTGQLAIASFTSKTFNYETKQIYNFTVEARNRRGNSDLQMATADVYIRITSQNEYRTVCLAPNGGYNFSVNSLIGSTNRTIGRLTSSDQDFGTDGQVRYSIFDIQPASNAGLFTVARSTGVVSISAANGNQNNRVTRSRVILSVLVANQGRLIAGKISTCSVTVYIRDGNDPPKFDHALYQAQIPEGETNGYQVIRVQANDWDYATTDNSRFQYRILAPISSPFAIHPTSGHVTVNGVLDREAQSLYNLTLGAVDRGTPPLTGTAVLKITILDRNDLGPVFVPANPQLHIQEGLGKNALVGSLVSMTRDQDGPGNGSPFFYSLVRSGANADRFHLRSNGLLFTKQTLDREKEETMILEADITDSGIPAMTSRVTFSVVVDDVNDSPSSARKLSLHVTQYESVALVGPAGEVRPSDADITGVYHCDLGSTSRPSGIVIGPDCLVFVVGSVPPGSHKLSLRHNDGVHAYVTSEDVTISVSNIVDKTAAERGLVELVFSKVVPHEILLPRIANLLSQVQRLTGASNSTVVFAGLTSSPGLLITSEGARWSSVGIWQALSKRKTELNAVFGQHASILNIRYDLCSETSSCNDNAISCKTLARIHLDRDLVRLTSSTVTWAHPKVEWRPSCTCKDNYVGIKCQSSSVGCPAKYCRNGGTCYLSQSGSPRCFCPAFYTGLQCEDDVNECVPSTSISDLFPASKSPCLYGSCINSLGNYSCKCQPASWHGQHCNSPTNHCAVSPCKNGGTCLPTISGYQCRCRFGFYGPHCQRSAWGLYEGSYISQSVANFTEYSLTMELATVQSNALLLYHKMSNQFNLVVSLVKGRVTAVVVPEVGDVSNPLKVQSSLNVANGNWFRLRIIKRLTTVELTVSQCDFAQQQCTASFGAPKCFPINGDVVTCSKFEKKVFVITSVQQYFNTKGTLYLIGLPMSLSPPGITSFDLVGCLRRFTSSFTVPVKMMGVSNTSCPRPDVPPCSKPLVCGKIGASCVDEWFQARCICPDGYEPPNCRKGYQGFAFSPNTILGVSLRSGAQRKFASGKALQQRKKRATEPDIGQSSATTSIKLKMKSNALNGVILLTITDQHNYSFLSIQNGILVLTDQLNRKRQAVRHSGPGLKTDAVHSIHLYRWSSGRLGLVVDSSVTQIPWTTSHNPLGPTVTQIYIAGLTSEWTKLIRSIPNFSGCISEVRMNDQVLPMSGLTERYNVSVLSGSVSPGCSSGACLSHVCERGFRCNDTTQATWGTASCLATGELTEPQFMLAVMVPSIAIPLLFIILTVAICLIRHRHSTRKHKPKQPGPMVAPQRPLPPTEKGYNLAYLGSIAGRPRSLANHSNNSTATTRSGLRQDHANGLVGHHYISKHIDRELANPPGHHQPDLLPPCDTVMMLPGLAGHSTSIDPSEDPYQLGPPEHYDLDHASSLAPSDVLDLNRVVPPSASAGFLHQRSVGWKANGVGSYATTGGSVHSSMGSRIYEKLGSQASTTSQEAGPRYPYAYRHQHHHLQPRPTPSPRTSSSTVGGMEDMMRRQPSGSRRRSPLYPPSVVPLPPPLSPTSSAAPSIDSFTGSEMDEEADQIHTHIHNPMVLGACLPPPLPPTLRTRGSWRQPPSYAMGNATGADELAASLEPMLGWGQRYEALVGVFQDLACLPNTDPPEEYV